MWLVALCAAALLGCTPPAYRGSYTAEGKKEHATKGTYHIVARGETIWSIARLYGAKPVDIVERNGIDIEGDDVRNLEVGRKLFIPGAEGTPPEVAAGVKELKKRTESERINAETRFMRPIAGRTISDFGQRTEVGSCKGLDIRALEGTEVVAAKSGIVLERTTIGGWGRIIILNHGSGEKTLYAHLQTADVSPGDRVKQGQVIGTVGSSGRVTRPTLHFRIYRDGKPVDPQGPLSFQ